MSATELRRFQVTPEEWIVIQKTTRDEWPVEHVTERGSIRKGLDASEAMPWLQLHYQLEAVELLGGMIKQVERVIDRFERMLFAADRALAWRPWRRGR